MARFAITAEAEAEAPNDAAAPPKRVRPYKRRPPIKLMRKLLAKLPLRRQRLLLGQLRWEIENEIRAVAQMAAVERDAEERE